MEDLSACTCQRFSSRSRTLLKLLAPLLPFGTDETNHGNRYRVPNSEQSMYFVTVKGSGHMVPQYKPGFALTFLNNVINFKF